MKAARINEYGDPSVVEVVDIDKPTVQEGMVLVEVHASSLNPFDSKIRDGSMKEMIPLELPVTLGGDIAGIVSEVGDGVTNVSVGDKVFGQANVVAGNSGAFAEFALTKAEQVALAPSNIGLQQAAAVVLVGVSAWQSLVQHINLQPEQKIFIHGGAGGIGAIAIQIAKNVGAYVATTATGSGLELVKNLGTDEIIDYKSQNFAEILSDYDAAFDTVGGDDFNTMLGILKSGGTAVSMIAKADEAKAAELGVTAIMQSTHVTTEALNALRTLVEDGIVTPHIGPVFPLEQTKEAFEARESGAEGKVILTIKED